MTVLKIATTVALAITGLAMTAGATTNGNSANVRLLSFAIAITQVLAIAFMWQR